MDPSSPRTNHDFVGTHPDNGRYFLFRGRPLALITTGEHYGAVINLDFDYLTYLDTLQSWGFNFTRVFTFFREQEGEFGGKLGHQNTLAPRPGRYLAPWRRSYVPGACDGGNKFDLDQWDEAYFARLRDFCLEAGRRDIIVEVTLFSQYYSDKPTGPWRYCPLNSANNVNGVGGVKYFEFTGRGDRALLSRQEALVHKIVSALRDVDNVYYEICNEPNPLPEDPQLPVAEIARWQNHLASAIAAAEADLPPKHMIAVCDCNEHIDASLFSILNYHYDAWMAKGVASYLGLRKPIVFDETYTDKFDDRRQETWSYIMKGCAGYSFLDLFFATDDPTGTGQAAFPDGQRYTGEVMRLYLQHLSRFFHRLDFTAMEPDNSVVTNISETVTVDALANRGHEYAVYINGDALKRVTVTLPRGLYHIECYNPRTGKADDVLEGIRGGGEIVIPLPLYEGDIALWIVEETSRREDRDGSLRV